MKSIKKTVVLYDLETEYLDRLVSYLEEKGPYPFSFVNFFTFEKCRQYAEKQEIFLFVVSRRAYEEEKEFFCEKKILLLEEKEIIKDTDKTEGFFTEITSKYQAGDKILEKILSLVVEEGDFKEIEASKGRMKKIGVYSPVHGCLQTSFALCLGQYLARKNKVLYINFEAYSGFSQWRKEDNRGDLADVFYYMSHAGEQMFYRLKSMILTINGLDYIPPAISGQDIGSITSEQWKQFFEELDHMTEYDYLILDLSEIVQGLFQIMDGCEKIYTIEKCEKRAKAKMMQYESLLESLSLKNILQKTKKIKLPQLTILPDSAEELPLSDLGIVIRQLMEEDTYAN